MVVDSRQAPPLIVHLIHRLDIGGLENGLVNLIDNMPAERFRHAVVCLTDYSDFARRIQRPDVGIYALHKKPGKDPGVYRRLWRVLRELRPTVVHSRNLSALDSQFTAWLAGVPCRVHSEHGWDMVDLHGENKKYRLLRKLLQPCIHRFLALSRHQLGWMQNRLAIPANKLQHIYNGVDAGRFHPAPERAPLPDADWRPGDDLFVIGTVGRMQTVKDQLTLARAFAELVHSGPGLRDRARLAMVGDGPLRAEVDAVLTQAGVRDRAWLPGPRDDVADLLRGLDLFVLPSLNEGISNTILEAMASGLPVLATSVGGNPELVQADRTGKLVPARDPAAMAAAMAWYMDRPSAVAEHGRAARARIENEFSLPAMIDGYLDFYDAALRAAGVRH